MKFLIVLLFALLAVSFTSATYSYQCGKYQCPPNHSCICDGGNTYRCVYQCPEVSIKQTIVNRWADNNGKEPKVQVSVDIINHTHRTVKDLIIATDAKLAFNQIWSVDKNGYFISLPDYATIAPGAKYTFGYINIGTTVAHMWVGNVYLI